MARRLLKGSIGMENPSIGRLATIGALPADIPTARDDDAVSGWWGYLVAWVKTILTAAVYTKLIVLFLFQVARVDGQSMAPTLSDHDRLIKRYTRLDLMHPH